MMDRGEVICRALAVLTMIILLAFLFFMHGAHAHTQHGMPMTPTIKWLELQRMPNTGTSCCHVSEGYPVERYDVQVPDEVCWQHGRGKGCMRAWIADGSFYRYPDGREHLSWDINVPVYVQKGAQNPEEDDLDNPTDHSWLWFIPSQVNSCGHDNEHPCGSLEDDRVSSVYCFIRHPNGF